MHFNKEILPGYFWIFPLKDNISNVGLGILSKTISEKKLNLRELFAKVLDTPEMKSRFGEAEMITKVEGFGLPFGSRKVTISGNRFMLCGDAASLIDPASGEGIGYAIVSGRYAGWHAKKCFEKNDFSAQFMLAYQKTVYDKLWKLNYKRYLLQKLINGRFWTIDFFVNITNKLKKIKLLTKIFV